MTPTLFCARVRGGLLAHGRRAEVVYDVMRQRLVVRAGDRWLEVPLDFEALTGDRHGWLDFRRAIVGGLLEVLEMPGNDYSRLVVGGGV